jgi:hypothetical protein
VPLVCELIAAHSVTQLERWEPRVLGQTSTVFYIMGTIPVISVQAKQLRTVQGEWLMGLQASIKDVQLGLHVFQDRVFWGFAGMSRGPFPECPGVCPGCSPRGAPGGPKTH